MRIVIAGGRNHKFTRIDHEFLNECAGITEVVSGGARGADICGELWADSRGLPVKVFPADWEGLGKGAGHIRNKQMAEYADGAILFPGGTGTANMKQQMLKLNKPVVELNYHMCMDCMGSGAYESDLGLHMCGSCEGTGKIFDGITGVG